MVDVCGTALSGATVTVKSGGVTIATGTTSGGGSVTLNIGSAGTYDVTVSKTGVTAGTQTMALTCGQTVAWDFGPHGSTLSLTDANTTLSTGAGTLTFVGGSPRTWTGAYCQNYSSANCTAGALSSGPIQIQYVITCFSNGTVQVNRKWPESHNPGLGFGNWHLYQANVFTGTPPCSNNDQASCFGTNTNNALNTSAPSSYVPFAWSGSMGAPTGFTADPVGGTVTLS